MLPKLNVPGWHYIKECSELLPKETTYNQLVKYLIELRFIKANYDLNISTNTDNGYIMTIYYNFGDFDYTDAYLSEKCLQLVIDHIYIEIEQDFIIERLYHLLDLKELGKATDEEVENYKSENKLL